MNLKCTRSWNSRFNVFGRRSLFRSNANNLSLPVALNRRFRAPFRVLEHVREPRLFFVYGEVFYWPVGGNNGVPAGSRSVSCHTPFGNHLPSPQFGPKWGRILYRTAPVAMTGVDSGGTLFWVSLQRLYVPRLICPRGNINSISSD